MSKREVSQRRSIPAYAGEPPIRFSTSSQLKVYPRVCGGTPLFAEVQPFILGLSPRMRGNPTQRLTPHLLSGSIPAYAGEPICWIQQRSSGRVYPRVCGGTGAGSAAAPCLSGLSPRMRGNRPVGSAVTGGEGSIPAYAGEPPTPSGVIGPGPVYPRVCGGTQAIACLRHAASGLSPRMRGNLVVRRRSGGFHGSIPAYAGEPMSGSRRSGGFRVYPRVCGGTCGVGDWPSGRAGLSPRMRGNPRPRILAKLLPGSIPAYAGEPQPAIPPGPARTVYPRVCGGTRCR